LQGIAQHADVAVGVVIPGNGDLYDGVTQAAGDEQCLDVEGPAGDADQWKDRLGHIRAKAFETALRILQPGQDDEAYHPVEDPPNDVTVFGFAETLGAGRFARGDGYPRVFQ